MCFNFNGVLLNFADGKKRGPFATKFVGHKGAVCGLKVSESQILE